MRSRIIWAIVLAVVWNGSGEPYRRLSRRDRRDFVRAVDDLSRCYDEGRYEVFREFADGTLERYRGILLDPGSRELVEKYRQLAKLRKDVKDALELRKWQEGIDRDIADTLELVKMMYAGVRYAKSVGRDSIAGDWMLRAKKLGAAYYHASPGAQRYRELVKHGYRDSSFLKRVGRDLEETLREQFVELSASMDTEALREFQKENPDVFQSDIEALLVKARAKDRLRALRKLQVEEMERYYAHHGYDEEVKKRTRRAERRRLLRGRLDVERLETYARAFGMDDVSLWTAVENKLYSRFLSDLSVGNALLYLRYFENGRFAPNVRTWVGHLTEMRTEVPDDAAM